MQHSILISNLLVKPLNQVCAAANAILFSDHEPSLKIEAVLGRTEAQINDERVSVNLNALENAVLVCRIVAATTVFFLHKPLLLYRIISEWMAPENFMLRLPARHGLITGLVAGVNLLTPYVDWHYENDEKLFKLLEALTWVKGEDNALLYDLAGMFSNDVAVLVKTMTGGRARAIGTFLEDISSRHSEEGAYPSPLAEQVIDEFEQKARKALRVSQALANTAAALKA